VTKTLHEKTLFGVWNFGHAQRRRSCCAKRLRGEPAACWKLPFDLAQGGERAEPFDIWDLAFGISIEQ